MISPLKLCTVSLQIYGSWLSGTEIWAHISMCDAAVITVTAQHGPCMMGWRLSKALTTQQDACRAVC